MLRKTLRHFSKGGIHPKEMKLTSGMKITDSPLPRRVTLAMNQSIGSAAVPDVTVGQHVCRYEIVGKADGIISANVHSPISGTVKFVGQAPGLYGHPTQCVIVEANDEDHFEDIQRICDAMPVMDFQSALSLTPEEIIAKTGNAGIVGLGGATFPTAAKLSGIKTGLETTLLINGAECEPYLTCDEAIMREMPYEIMQGISLLMKAIGTKHAIVGIENNKPEAIRLMKSAARAYEGITITPLRTRYPQGGEKMLAQALTGRKIAPGQLPVSQGIIIQNVATALAVYHAVIWGLPLVERVITVSGKDYAAKGNYRVAIGTDLSSITKSGGQIPGSTIKIVAGGTMMGLSLASIAGYVTKGLSGLLFLSADETEILPSGPCVRCARCSESCPMGLQPYLLARLSELGRVEEARANHIADCMECGCCSYSCIARRKLVDWIKTGKEILRRK